jgi:hypothetical protein
MQAGQLRQLGRAHHRIGIGRGEEVQRRVDARYKPQSLRFAPSTLSDRVNVKMDMASGAIDWR